MWVLGTGLRSSARTTNALNQQTIFPGPLHHPFLAWVSLPSQLHCRWVTSSTGLPWLTLPNHYIVMHRTFPEWLIDKGLATSVTGLERWSIIKSNNFFNNPLPKPLMKFSAPGSWYVSLPKPEQLVTTLWGQSQDKGLSGQLGSAMPLWRHHANLQEVPLFLMLFF